MSPMAAWFAPHMLSLICPVQVCCAASTGRAATISAIAYFMICLSFRSLLVIVMSGGGGRCAPLHGNGDQLLVGPFLGIDRHTFSGFEITQSHFHVLMSVCRGRIDHNGDLRLCDGLDGYRIVGCCRDGTEDVFDAVVSECSERPDDEGSHRDECANACGSIHVLSPFSVCADLLLPVVFARSGTAAPDVPAPGPQASWDSSFPSLQSRKGKSMEGGE